MLREAGGSCLGKDDCVLAEITSRHCRLEMSPKIAYFLVFPLGVASASRSPRQN